jgi:pre-rRNA-processing protein TSR3
MLKPTLVFRHKKENLKKCSLRGLEKREDFRFYSFPLSNVPEIDNYILLTLDAPELTENDKDLGLILIDATWKLADDMLKKIPHQGRCIPRSLPNYFKTAYPRRQTLCPNPETGLASVEALFLAYNILGHDTTGLLDNYYWKDQFLQINQLEVTV